MSAAPAVVEIRGVSLRYQDGRAEIHALDDVSLSIAGGEFVCLLGPSGCGKTSLLRLLAGFLFPTAGRLLFEGAPIQGPSAERGVVFQHPALYPWLSVAENVAFGPRLRGVEPALREARTDALLHLVGLHDFRERAPWELSGGMQQRAAIARALIGEPRILLMDEPFGALDALTREHMQEELLKIWRATRTTVVLVTHSVEEAIYLGTRTIVLSRRPGRVVADVPTAFSRENVGSRTIKSRPDFIAVREELLARIWASAD